MYKGPRKSHIIITCVRARRSGVLPLYVNSVGGGGRGGVGGSSAGSRPRETRRGRSRMGLRRTRRRRRRVNRFEIIKLFILAEKSYSCMPVYINIYMFTLYYHMRARSIYSDPLYNAKKAAVEYNM